MIYISLSVNELNSTFYFFTKVLRIFDGMTDSRLICNSGIELIIDLYEIGSDRHRNVFGIDTHAPASIAMHHGEGIKIKILSRLKELEVKHELIGNIAGLFLNLEDPTGNKIAIWSHHGGIV
ncbi:MAG TPA: hypothetical protein VLE50_09985 [Cellvibrio sp.]|nr:hypothetical protein [Cellvibrio sp.]